MIGQIPCCEHCGNCGGRGHVSPCLSCIVLLNQSHGDMCQKSAVRFWQVLMEETSLDLASARG